MKPVWLMLLSLIFVAGVSIAQNNPARSQLEIMRAVVNSESVDSVEVKLSVKENGGEMFDISPNVPHSATMIITGTPYSKIHLKVPSATVLRHPSGREAELRNIRLLAGNSKVPTSMDVLSPGECNELSVSETGQIYIRIGARITGGEPLKGIYIGRLHFDCDNLMNEAD